jgi:hypothetical protein
MLDISPEFAGMQVFCAATSRMMVNSVAGGRQAYSGAQSGK